MGGERCSAGEGRYLRNARGSKCLIQDGTAGLGMSVYFRTFHITSQRELRGFDRIWGGPDGKGIAND